MRATGAVVCGVFALFVLAGAALWASLPLTEALHVSSVDDCARAACPDLAFMPEWISKSDGTPTVGPPVVETSRWAADSCAFLDGYVPEGQHSVFRANTYLWNAGPAHLDLGSTDENPRDFEWSTCHGHFHMKEAIALRLWTPAGFETWNGIRGADKGSSSEDLLMRHPDLASSFVAGRKLAFCFHEGSTPDELGRCDHPGLDVGHHDMYPRGIDGQWIVVDALPPGQYVLEEELNPGRAIPEADYSNNRVAAFVELPEAPPLNSRIFVEFADHPSLPPPTVAPPSTAS